MKGLGLLVALWSALAPPLANAEGASEAVQADSPSKAHASTRAVRPIVVADVVLQPGGVLHGAVSSEEPESMVQKPVAGIPVALLRDGKVVAETRSDRDGRFAVSHVRGGKYAIAVRRPDCVEWSFHRVWTPAASPPKASAVAHVVMGKGVVRGQGALPALSFSEAALMAGVVVGAVAAPIIYHNAQKSNRVPASP